MGEIRPWRDGQHAIIRSAFAVEFATPLDRHVFQTVSRLHAASKMLKETFPRKVEPEGVFIRFGGGHQNPQEDLGVTFDSLRPDGEQARALSLGPSHVAIMRADYARWESTWDECSKIFSLVLPTAARGRVISVLGLEVHDRFEWVGEKQDFKAENIFRKGSPYLPENVFNLNDLWHNHHGFFNRSADGKRKFLNNINISVGDLVEDKRIIDIVCTHRVMLEMSDGAELAEQLAEGQTSGNSTLATHMLRMHDFNKSVLINLLVEDTARRIGLNP